MGQGLGCCRTVYLSRSITWFLHFRNRRYVHCRYGDDWSHCQPTLQHRLKNRQEGQEALMWVCWAVIRTFKRKMKKLYSVLYSIGHQYKLNLRNKAGWRLHFAVHAYCAFYGWKYNSSLNIPPAPGQRTSRVVTKTALKRQHWAGGLEEGPNQDDIF